MAFMYGFILSLLLNSDSAMTSYSSSFVALIRCSISSTDPPTSPFLCTWFFLFCCSSYTSTSLLDSFRVNKLLIPNSSGLIPLNSWYYLYSICSSFFVNNLQIWTRSLLNSPRTVAEVRVSMISSLSAPISSYVMMF